MYEEEFVDRLFGENISTMTRAQFVEAVEGNLAEKAAEALKAYNDRFNPFAKPPKKKKKKKKN